MDCSSFGRLPGSFTGNQTMQYYLQSSQVRARAQQGIQSSLHNTEESYSKQTNSNAAGEKNADEDSLHSMPE
jgi:hypothetical protein